MLRPAALLLADVAFREQDQTAQGFPARIGRALLTQHLPAKVLQVLAPCPPLPCHLISIPFFMRVLRLVNILHVIVHFFSTILLYRLYRKSKARKFLFFHFADE